MHHKKKYWDLSSFLRIESNPDIYASPKNTLYPIEQILSVQIHRRHINIHRRLTLGSVFSILTQSTRHIWLAWRTSKKWRILSWSRHPANDHCPLSTSSITDYNMKPLWSYLWRVAFSILFSIRLWMGVFCNLDQLNWWCKIIEHVSRSRSIWIKICSWCYVWSHDWCISSSVSCQKYLLRYEKWSSLRVKYPIRRFDLLFSQEGNYTT